MKIPTSEGISEYENNSYTRFYIFIVASITNNVEDSTCTVPLHMRSTDMLKTTKGAKIFHAEGGRGGALLSHLGY